jgi:hypothetical protein
VTAFDADADLMLTAANRNATDAAIVPNSQRFEWVARTVLTTMNKMGFGPALAPTAAHNLPRRLRQKCFLWMKFW